MDTIRVRRAYHYWAPVYDTIFGPFSEASRRHALEIINVRRGRLLEVGVGTGLSLPGYGRHLDVTGIDISPEMLEKSGKKVHRERLAHIRGLSVMDASKMAFADDTFDTVVAMYVMRSVPEPEQVMREIERVCKPGGEVFLVFYVGKNDSIIHMTERQIAPLARRLGWNPIFETDCVMRCPALRLVRTYPLRPFGLFTMLHFEKQADRAVNGELGRLAAG